MLFAFRLLIGGKTAAIEQGSLGEIQLCPGNLIRDARFNFGNPALDQIALGQCDIERGR